MRSLKVLLLVFCGLVITYFGLMTVRNISVVRKPSELRTDHFVISYRGIYTSEAQDIAETLEENYGRIRAQLNDPQHDTIRVFVHSTQTEFNKATGLSNSTANGTSRGPNRFDLVWTTWYNSIFPDDPRKTAVHEFVHCVQLNILIKDALKKWDAVDSTDFDRKFEQKFINDYPQWFWEALCDYEAGVVNSLSVKYGMTNKPTLKDLSNSNQVYNVGYTIIEYLVETWGDDKLPALITSYVDIENVLGVSESDFEKGWVGYVNTKY